MNKEVEILRDALKGAIEDMKETGCYDERASWHVEDSIKRVEDALKIADEIKDGPNEEDKEWLSGLEEDYELDGHQAVECENKCVCRYKDVMALISKLKQTWGIV